MVEVLVPIPERSLAQRLAALERANEIRTYRAQLKRQVKAGDRPVHDVLARPEEEVETMKVFELLLASPKVGRVKANRWLRSCRISPSKTIGGLSERQRAELLSFIPPARRALAA